MRRFMGLLIICMMLLTLPAPAAFAAAKKTAGNTQTIMGFLPLKQSEYYYEGTPTQQQLVEVLPQTIGVYLDGQENAVQIPVRWKVVENYDKTDYYFYSVKPVWSEEYVLGADLNPMMDVPWVTMFRQVSKAQIKEGEQKLDIPTDSPKHLKKGYSENQVSLTDIFEICMDESYAASDSDVKKIYNYLTDTMGLNMAAACGVMTNLYAESGMQSNNLENTANIAYGLSDAEYTKRVNKGKKNNGKYTSGYGKTRYFTKDYSGYGICQWTTSGRRTKVLKAAVKKDVSIANLKMQLGVLKSELENDYPQVWATLQGVPNNAAGVYLAAAHFCASFEIPANTNNTAASRARTALSTYWKTYSGKSASASGKSYLGICGYTYPGAIHKGTGMTVSGHVISNYSVTYVRARILNEKGKSVYSSTRKPGSTIYSLYNFDSSMLFAKLSAGTYKYEIKAKDKFGKSVTVRHEFTVSSSNEAEINRGCAVKDTSASSVEKDPDPAKDKEPAASTLHGVKIGYPKTLKKGKSFTVTGKVKSNYRLQKVTILIRNAKAETVQKGSASLSRGKTYNLKKLDKKVSFGKLARGQYTYIVKAQDTQKSKQLLKKTFTVK